MARNGGGGNGQNNVTLMTSKIEEESFEFLWTIQNYSALIKGESDQVFRSEIFHGGRTNNHSWQLEICPRKKTKQYIFGKKEYFSIMLVLKEFGNGSALQNRYRQIKARYAFRLLGANANGQSKLRSSRITRQFTLSNGWGYPKYISSSDLMSHKMGLVVNDCLRIQCRVWIEGVLTHKVCDGLAANPSPPEEEKAKMRKERLSSDLAILYKKGLMTDVEIKCKNATYNAHKTLLVARSPVFAAMFNADMVEKSKNSVEILDFDDDVVKGMLEYLYTGETDMMPERAHDLLQIADKYDLAGLKQDSEYAIAENLNFENAAEGLALAHLYNAPLLKPRVIDYIKWNKEEVLKTKSFQEVAHANADVFVDLYLLHNLMPS